MMVLIPGRARKSSWLWAHSTSQRVMDALSPRDVPCAFMACRGTTWFLMSDDFGQNCLASCGAESHACNCIYGCYGKILASCSAWLLHIHRNTRYIRLLHTKSYSIMFYFRYLFGGPVLYTWSKKALQLLLINISPELYAEWWKTA
jgi:hypothetical protein